MPRPAKPMKTTKAAYTKEDIAARMVVENSIATDKLPSVPPKEWNDRRKAVFKWLYEALEKSGILCTLDKPSFYQACIIIDRLQELDEIIDKCGVADKELRVARSDYFKQFLSICAELGLSPTARAKIGTLIVNKKKEDPLLAALGGDVDA